MSKSLEKIVASLELCKLIPAGEFETKTGALHDSGDVEKYHVCETCAAWLDENTGRRVEK